MAQALCAVQMLACICRTWLAALIRPRSPHAPSSRAPLPDFADVALLAQNLGFRDGFEELGEPLRVIKCKAHCENVCSLRSSDITYSPPKPHSPSALQLTVDVILIQDGSIDRNDIVHEEHWDAAMDHGILHPRGPPIACMELVQGTVNRSAHRLYRRSHSNTLHSAVHV